MGSAPKSRQGIAAGILATARNFGMVLGVGIAGAIFITTLAHGSNGLIAPGLTQNAVIFRALELSFLTASLITLLGVFTSMVRVIDKS
jgi:Na+-transporting NADH:ubiquinone oxidoreductase subunit NqrE